MNRVDLTATLLERDALRYTPAGIPIVTVRLAHQSVQQEAGTNRTVEMELTAQAADRVALRIDTLALGSAVRLGGFLAPRRRNVRSLVLHITDIEPASPASTLE